MNINSDSLAQQIGLYLDGMLDEAQLKEFEKVLSTDPQVAHEIEKARIARVIIKNETLREKLKNIQKEEIINKRQQTNKKSLLINYIFLGFVALLLFFVIVKVLSINNEKLFEENYLTYYLPASQGQNSESSIVYNFYHKNYQDIIHMYENKPTHTNEASFFAGLSYLEMKKADSAIAALTDIIDGAKRGGDHSYFFDAEYYLGFAHLKAGNLSESNWYFSNVYHDIGHLYYEKLNKMFYWKVRFLMFKESLFD